MKFGPKEIHHITHKGLIPYVGFLYKIKTLFYEGGIRNKLMDGKGMLTMLSRPIEFKGWFKAGKLDGNDGFLVLKEKSITLKGEWSDGFPKKITYRNSFD